MRFIYTKTFILFFAFLVVLTGVVFLDSTNRIEPIRRFFLAAPKPVAALARSVTVPTRNFFVTLYNLRGMVNENQQLAAKVSGLEQQLVELENQKKENEALRQELGFVRSTKLDLAPCGVLSRNAFGLMDSVNLACGSQQGVEEGDAIISQGFLVGKVIRVSPTTSTALLAKAANFLTDAKIINGGAEGVLKGSYGFGMALEQLPQNAQADKGWLVATAGIDPKIPKNLPIGEIGEVTSSSNDLLKKATVVSPVDFKNIDFVFVVK